MSNSLLTPTKILREAGRLFHSKAKFIKSINRQYDNQYAQSGAKAGYSITLRDRNEYSVSSGATMVTQDTTEASQTLTIGTQKHIGMNFQSNDLALVIDDFSERYLVPAIARLVSTVEADIIAQAYKQVGNLIDNDGGAFAYLDTSKARQRLDEELTPDDDDRSLMMCPLHATKYMDATKGLFTPGGQLGKQYKDGYVQDAQGFNIFSSPKLTPHTSGTCAKVTGYSIDSTGTVTGSSITVKTGANTFKKGDVITIATLNAVDPETKADLGYLKQFTVTADYAGGAGLLAIRPALTPTGAKQNVSAAITADQLIVKVGAGASETLTQSLAYHKDAFIFATADLQDPSKYGAWGATEQMDTLSMRIWRQGDILNDKFPCRIDVFYGFLARYPNMACRMHADG
jgi:hypothetical protein